MSNKFLDLYPALREPCIGDLVKITRNPGSTMYCSGNIVGDIGTIIHIDNYEPRYLIRKKDNGIYEEHQGSYWISKEFFKIIN